MKAGTSSAVAFGAVLRTIRKHLSKNQSEIAISFSPALSVAAISMAEAGNRPPKTEAVVRGYAAALDVDDDALVDVWWAMQGLVGIDVWGKELEVPRWWRDMEPSDQAEVYYMQARSKASAKWTPNDDWYEPAPQLFALAEAICKLLGRMLGDSWKVDYRAEVGLREPIEGHLASIEIVLSARRPGEDDPQARHEQVGDFRCPEPVVRPGLPRPGEPVGATSHAADVAWILAAVEAMPVRDRAAVAGFIHGLREGGLYGENSSPVA